MRLLHIGDHIRAFQARSRDAKWKETQALFMFDGDRVLAMQRLTRVWTANLSLRTVNVFSGTIAHEQWSSGRIGELISFMASTSYHDRRENRMITSDLPRRLDRPLVVVRTQGFEFLIDGRRRANKWMQEDGHFPVHVISV